MAARNLIDGVATVPTAATRVQLTEQTGTVLDQILITALSTNTGVVVVGASTVVAAAGSHATPTRRGYPLAVGEHVTLNTDDLADVWLDATVSGDGISFVASQVE